jgi:hypothetical protein
MNSGSSEIYVVGEEELDYCVLHYFKGIAI